MKAKKILLLLNCLIYLFILPEAGPAAAAPPGVELKLVSPEEIMLEPGRTLTLSLLVINHSRTAFTFSEKLELPPDWQVIIPACTLRPTGAPGLSFHPAQFTCWFLPDRVFPRQSRTAERLFTHCRQDQSRPRQCSRFLV